MVAIFIDWKYRKSGGCQAWDSDKQAPSPQQSDWWTHQNYSLGHSQTEDVGDAVMCHHIPPLGLRHSFFPTAGILGYSQPTPLLDLPSAKLYPFPRSSQHLMPCESTKAWPHCLNLKHLWKAIPTPEFPMGLAEAFVLTASKSNFSLISYSS